MSSLLKRSFTEETFEALPLPSGPISALSRGIVSASIWFETTLSSRYRRATLSKRDWQCGSSMSETQSMTSAFYTTFVGEKTSRQIDREIHESSNPSHWSKLTSILFLNPNLPTVLPSTAKLTYLETRERNSFYPSEQILAFLKEYKLQSIFWYKVSATLFLCTLWKLGHRCHFKSTLNPSFKMHMCAPSQSFSQCSIQLKFEHITQNFETKNISW